VGRGWILSGVDTWTKVGVWLSAVGTLAGVVQAVLAVASWRKDNHQSGLNDQQYGTDPNLSGPRRPENLPPVAGHTRPSHPSRDMSDRQWPDTHLGPDTSVNAMNRLIYAYPVLVYSAFLAGFLFNTNHRQSPAVIFLLTGAIVALLQFEAGLKLIRRLRLEAPRYSLGRLYWSVALTGGPVVVVIVAGLVDMIVSSSFV
jgi:hypothetical protein